MSDALTRIDNTGQFSPHRRRRRLAIPLATKEAYEKVLEPKALIVLPIAHFEIYSEPLFSKAAGAAIGWFEKHL